MTPFFEVYSYRPSFVRRSRHSETGPRAPYLASRSRPCLSLACTAVSAWDLYPVPEPKDPEKPGTVGGAPEKPAATQTGEFNSGAGFVPSLDNSAEVLAAVFQKDAPGVLPRVFTLSNVMVVATVDERARPNDSEFEKQKAQLKNEAIKGKQFELREAFVKSLKSAGTVVVNTPAVEKAMGDS